MTEEMHREWWTVLKVSAPFGQEEIEAAKVGVPGSQDELSVLASTEEGAEGKTQSC
jgi:hypothetical protein